MADKTSILTALKDVLNSLGTNALITKNIIIKGDQQVFKKVGVKFSFRQWLRRINSQDFGLDNGYYEIYEETTLKNGSKFIMLELAVISFNVDRLLTNPDDCSVIKIRMPYDGEPLQYVEVTKFT